ncbi:hypothetical protein ANN_07283 [Periplaneta americana]|uniref:Cation-transporting ATPase n=1 Tax=Periplaneta americana TaxID=6978 RepID=A0ABQ8THZ3_PERAM|nr:hypothetical protein ANN_07283 [Periplaneta americana]
MQEVYGYERDAVRTVLTWLCVVLTAGTLRLVFHWYPQWLLYATHIRCPLCSATKILVVENYLGKHKTYFVKDVQTISTNTANPNSVLSGPTEESAKRLNLALSQGVRVQLHNGATKDIQKVRSVRIKKLCYIWDEERSEFVKLAGLDKGLSKADFHQFSGYNEYQQLLRRSVYGPNDIPVQVQSLLTLLLLEVINPFYIFQLFTLCVWAAEGYIYYLIAIVLMTTFGVTSTILQTRRNQKSLHDTVHSSDVVTVWRGGDQYEDLPTTALVPGDVIVVPPHGCDMHCDAVLLSGSCIVNESMLTAFAAQATSVLYSELSIAIKSQTNRPLEGGAHKLPLQSTKREENTEPTVLLNISCILGESVPVNKTSIPRLSGVPYDPKEDVNHTLFCGTKVIQTRFYGNERVCAVVLRTGFLTAKGSLVRSILYPPPADFKFDQDSYKFIGILAVIAAIGFVYTIVLKIHKEQSAGDIAIKALDLITIVIPPALPAALTVGKLYAQNRLQACKIFCINSRVINVAGSIDCVCFDKTGTLTEDGLDMNGALPVEDRQFHGIEHDVQQIKGSGLELGMAACHSLTLIDGALSGDPLDVKMFESTGWQLEEPDVADHDKYDLIIPTIVKSPGEAPTEIGLVHQFQFSSTLQRMSVVTRTLGSTDFVLYCKGSPEMIVSLSRPDTVPEDLPSTLQQYTEKGHRVIAIGRRVLEESSYTKIQRMRREDAEQDLEFLGMFVLENRLKMESQPVIKVLKAARIKVVMITGDNVLTAISVAKECDIIEPGEIVVDVTAVPSVKDAPPRVFYTSAHGKEKKCLKELKYVAFITYPVQNLLGGFSEECFQNMGGVIVAGRRIKCIRFADDMALLAEEETILRDMLLELNDSCEQYGMKINANKTKTMSVALYEAETWTLRRSEEKRIEAFEMWIWRRMERVKWTDRIRNEAVVERVGEERMMLKLIRKRKMNWLGHWLRRNCLLKDALEGMQIATLNGGGDVEAGIGHDRYKLALTGKSWEVIRENFPELVPRICTRGAIFARMSSDQKQQLVQELQGLGYYVAMCGDGANDCGALKAAHVGISLSEAESSVASPFTSKEANISCVPTVIREGRAALSTSSGIFRFMVAYSLTEFLSCIVLYAVNSNLTDLQFLFIDICLIVNFAFFFGKTRAYTGPLVTDPPLTSLLSFIPVMSITLHMVMITIIQTAAFFTVRQFSWYPSYNKKNDDDYACDENFAVYSVSLFQYIASAIVFSQGKPYRKGIHTNIFLMVSLVVMTIICAYKTVYPANWLLNFMNYTETPGFDFKIIVLCLAVINLVMTLFVESVFVNVVLAKVARPLWTKLTGLGGKERRFVIVDREAVSERWPPVCRDLPIKLNASFPELRTPVKTVDIQMKFCGTSNASRTNLGFSDEPL